MDPSELTSLQHQPEKSDTKINEDNGRRRKSKKAKIVESCGSNFDEYSGCTSIHGIQYLGANKKSMVERVWWFIMIVVSTSLGCYFIRNLWNKWNETPVIVTFAETATPIWQIPFPAVTICSMNQIPQSRFNVTEGMEELKKKNWNEFTEEEKTRYRTVSHACRNFNVPHDENFTDEQLSNRLKELYVPDSEEFICRWKRQQTFCSKLWNSVTSDKGFCYTFNALNPTEIFKENAVQYREYGITNSSLSEGWTLVKGYPGNTSPERTFPRRISSTSVKGGFEINLLISLEEYSYLCSEMDSNHRISLHLPSDHPRMSRDYFTGSMKQFMFISIKPTMISTSKEVANYDPVRRQCFMENEKFLKYFKIYSLGNCEWECLSNHTLERCGCVAHWMPREDGMPICSVGKLQCIKDVRYELEELDLLYEYAKGTGNESEIKKLEKLKSKCNCLPTCTSLTYEIEVTQNPIDLSKTEKLFHLKENELKSFGMFSATFFFKEPHFITKRRSELYGMNDFLSNCGGILGLFMGFSLLSFIEIIYFAIIRPICALREAKATSK